MISLLQNYKSNYICVWEVWWKEGKGYRERGREGENGKGEGREGRGTGEGLLSHGYYSFLALSMLESSPLPSLLHHTCTRQPKTISRHPFSMVKDSDYTIMIAEQFEHFVYVCLWTVCKINTCTSHSLSYNRKAASWKISHTCTWNLFNTMRVCFLGPWVSIQVLCFAYTGMPLSGVLANRRRCHQAQVLTQTQRPIFPQPHSTEESSTQERKHWKQWNTSVALLNDRYPLTEINKEWLCMHKELIPGRFLYPTGPGNKVNQDSD